ncbi:MAG: hypothetical protein A2Z32_08870 [Chloroflexi bacterium RBG_16_69_14]|nr:MAG: hypothetical protein A2Z32_08870 [Chloroflexi bacterium RBG_16_69_14]
MDARIETTPTPSTPTYRIPRSVLLAGAAIAALIVIALIVAVALPARPTEYPAGSAEAAFQDFYRAWESRDIDAAYHHLSTNVTGHLSLSEYRSIDSDQSWQRDQDRRLVLLGADVTGDRAVLRIRVDEFSGGGIGGRRSSFERSVRLVREDGTWLIDEPLVGIESVGFMY